MNYFVFLLIPIALSVLYLLVVMMEVPGFAEERLGFLLHRRGFTPRDVNVWKPDHESAKAREAERENLVRETRVFRDPTGGFMRRGRYLWQVRYLDEETGEVVRTEPDRPLRRWLRRRPR